MNLLADLLNLAAPHNSFLSPSRFITPLKSWLPQIRRFNDTA